MRVKLVLTEIGALVVSPEVKVCQPCKAIMKSCDFTRSCDFVIDFNVIFKRAARHVSLGEVAITRQDSNQPYTYNIVIL